MGSASIAIDALHCVQHILSSYGLDHLTDALLHGIPDAVDQIRLLVLFLWPPEKMVVNEQDSRAIALKV